MKRYFEKGDLISYSHRGQTVFAHVENVWRSRNTLNVRPMGQHEKFEIEVERVNKVL